MAFWQSKKRTSAVLIDIDSASIAGAYVYTQTGETPVICYTLRLPIEPHQGEPIAQAMLRTLEALSAALIKDGAPTLHRETGSGHIDHILVSVGAPWQETKVTNTTIQRDKNFPFTHTLLAEAVGEAAKVAPGRVDSGHGVIATLLNGYEIENPFGKQVKRADLFILSSTLDAEVTHGIEQILRHTYHTHEITFTAFAPAAYSIFRELYPHEKDFLILDVSDERIDLALINHGYLVDVATCANGTNGLVQAGRDAYRMTAPTTRAMHQFIDPERNARFGSEIADREKKWVESVRDTLATLSARHALPRTIFLIAPDDSRAYLKQLLDAPDIHTLWLSDEPLGIVPVAQTQFATLVQTRALGSADIYLAILALYYQRTFAV